MDCQQIEEFISMYIEDELPEDLHAEVSLHLRQCSECRKLKEKMEELICFFPELDEEVPFYLKNRLYYIPESQSVDYGRESRFNFIKWAAAMIGTMVLSLNIFYFTDIHPPTNYALHSVVSEIKVFSSDAGAFVSKVAESRGMFLLKIFKKDKESDRKSGSDLPKKTTKNKGGTNDGNQKRSN
ncbi:MAG: anti-sigma factor family protein [Candidatus Omnitrophota bacterium]